MTVAAFHEQWFPSASQDVLGALVQSVAEVPGHLVEFGSWEGRSTCAMARAAFPRPVVAVDTWQGSPGEISADLAAKRDVFAQFKANIAYLTRGNVRPQRMGWREWVGLNEEPIALAFIDAEHTYREVFDNITAVLPFLSPGAVLCGDDVHHPPVWEAVTDLLDGVERDATLWIWRKP